MINQRSYIQLGMIKIHHRVDSLMGEERSITLRDNMEFRAIFSRLSRIHR